MAQLIPVDHDPFDMAASLAAAGGDPLVPPPRNPMAPPQGLVDALSGAVKKNLDWASVPGRVARGVEPETPGQWSEEDEFRRQHLASSPYEWGPQTAFGEVFWPRTGANVGGSGFNVGSGAIIPPKQGIRAYHGSPHDFDRFDLSKIGTGEGAQSYGHGLYFAEAEPVARQYRDQLKLSRSKLPDDILSLPPDMRQAVMTHARTDADAATAAKRAQYMSSNLRSVDLPKVQDMVERARDAERGRMYEVNINAKPEQFLDWDRPLAGQPEIYDRLKTADKAFGRLPWDKTSVAYPTPGSTGSDALRAVESKLRYDASYSGNPIAPSQSYADASSALREAGIPGIKYLDQGSRKIVDLEKIIDQSMSPDRVRLAKQELEQLSPSSNYVVFDDKIIDILHKYGIGGLSMLPPAVAAHVQSRLIPVDHDPFAQ